jgi:hypothetical protein
MLLPTPAQGPAPVRMVGQVEGTEAESGQGTALAPDPVMEPEGREAGVYGPGTVSCSFRLRTHPRSFGASM